MLQYCSFHVACDGLQGLKQILLVKVKRQSLLIGGDWEYFLLSTTGYTSYVREDGWRDTWVLPEAVSSLGING